MISEVIAAYIQSREDAKNIIFVLLQGGYARGTATQSSDVDLLIVYSGDINKIRYDSFDNKVIELRYLDIDTMESPKSWLERSRFVFANESLFIYGNKEKYYEILKDVKMDKQEQLDLLIYCLKRCRTRGLIPMSISPNAINKRTYWDMRGDEFSKHMFLLSGLDYVITMIYALNNVFLPSPKYRYYNINRLQWIPQKWGELTENICKNGRLSITDKDYGLLVDVVDEIIDEINNRFSVIVSNEYLDEFSVSTDIPLFKENKDF